MRPAPKFPDPDRVSIPIQFGIEDYSVRCRTCPKCLASAQWDWSRRADIEDQAASYSVFGSLTFSERFYARTWREKNSRDVRSTFVDPPAFQERDRQSELAWMLREFTLYLKRLRKARLAVRYLAVTEYGTKNGRPHIHFIMHIHRAELRKRRGFIGPMPPYVMPYRTLRKVLKSHWEHFPGCGCSKKENCRIGWADIRQVKTVVHCHYVAKYIGKQWESVTVDGEIRANSARSRVRASIGYGDQRNDRS